MVVLVVAGKDRLLSEATSRSTLLLNYAYDIVRA